jgi:hypothetical protein
MNTKLNENIKMNMNTKNGHGYEHIFINMNMEVDMGGDVDVNVDINKDMDMNMTYLKRKKLLISSIGLLRYCVGLIWSGYTKTVKYCYRVFSCNLRRDF